MDFSKLLRAPATSPAQELREVIGAPHFWNHIAESTLDYVPIEKPTENRPFPIAELKERGIANFGEVLDREYRTQVCQALAVISRRRWPKVCVILCDAFWDLLRSPRLSSALTQTLGEGYQMAPRVWLTEVTAHDGATGWRPHLDARKPPRFDDAGLPLRLTTWCALTAATTRNGCIHILPREVAGAFPRDLFASPTFSAERMLTLLQSARAMPAAAGQVLLWGKDIVHWGGRVSGTPEIPRLSITTEFVSRRAKREAGEPAFLNIQKSAPSFSERQQLLSYSILKYAEYEEEKYRLSSFLDLARLYL